MEGQSQPLDEERDCGEGHVLLYFLIYVRVFFFLLPCEIFQVAFMSWLVQTSLPPHPTSFRRCVCMIVRMNVVNVAVSEFGGMAGEVRKGKELSAYTFLSQPSVVNTGNQDQSRVWF